MAFIEQVCQHDPLIATAFTLSQEFGQLLRLCQGEQHLEQWKAAVRESGIAELIRFVDGLADDAVAIANACTKEWSNGIVEGFNHKVKWIKRSSYGQAGFPLLQRRVLLSSAQGSHSSHYLRLIITLTVCVGVETAHMSSSHMMDVLVPRVVAIDGLRKAGNQ